MVSITIYGLKYFLLIKFFVEGKWWGPTSEQPIIAIHGWQDNAGTWDRLIPLLPGNIPVLAIDLPGHGLSSHYPPGQFYYLFWDGVSLVSLFLQKCLMLISGSFGAFFYLSHSNIDL